MEYQDNLEQYFKLPFTNDEIKLNHQQTKIDDFDMEGRLKYDPCFVRVETKQSIQPCHYQLDGYDPTLQNREDYINQINNRIHFQKVYHNTHDYVTPENKLIYSDLTNKRNIHQLYTTPYVGWYQGAGTPSTTEQSLESALQQSVSTRSHQKPCDCCADIFSYRDMYLPEFGNPQRIQVIEPPPPRLGGWFRNGNNTRDYVRRIDYQRRCKNEMNNGVLYKHN